MNLGRLSDGKFLKWYFKYGALNLVMLIPAYIVNLLIVASFVALKIPGYWILSSVIVGDITAFVINHNLSVWLQIHWKWLHRMQDESKELIRG